MNTKPDFRPVWIALLMGIFLVGLFLFSSTLSPTNVQAASRPLSIPELASPITYTVDLPLIFRSDDPSVPKLASPQNGAVLETLIPTFIWDNGAQPAGISGCLALSMTPHPTECHLFYPIDYYGSHMEEVMWYNLQANTVYYWRVGAVNNNDYDHPKWSVEWSFTTGAVGGPVLPDPVLQSPSNNSEISTSKVTFTWHPVAGAIAYSVTLHALDTDRWIVYYYNITTTQQVIYIASYVQTGYGKNYEWFVETRNGYAWGTPSDKWKFTYTGTMSSSSRYFIPGETILRQKDGIQVVDVR